MAMTFFERLLDAAAKRDAVRQDGGTAKQANALLVGSLLTEWFSKKGAPKTRSMKPSAGTAGSILLAENKLLKEALAEALGKAAS